MPPKTKAKSLKSKPVRGARVRADGSAVVCLAAYVPAELAQAARIRAIEQGGTVSSLVTHALGEHLGAA